MTPKRKPAAGWAPAAGEKAYQRDSKGKASLPPVANCAKPYAGKVGGASTKRRAVKSQSTDTAAQEKRILEALRAGPKTTDNLRALGCYQVSARVFGLRAKGFNIETSLYDGWAVDGYSHRKMARYELVSEPEPKAGGSD